MDIAVVDIEATGLDTATVNIHCIVVQRPGRVPISFQPEDIGKGILFLNRLIAGGTVLAGHNIIRYDIPILMRYGMNDPGQVYDTLLVSRATYPGSTLYARDQEMFKKLPGLREHIKVGAHSLHAWGLRLGEHKMDYSGGFEVFTQEMLTYCLQDVLTNVHLLEFLRERIPDDAAMLECEVGRICERMSNHGVAFDVQAAEGFTVTLIARRSMLAKQLKEKFGVWYEPEEVKTPKRPLVSRKLLPGQPGYKNIAAGCEFQNVKRVEFNPASTDHIAKRLQDQYGWKPTQYTETGKPQITAEVLNDLPYPEAKLLAEYQEIKKILGYVAEGQGAWLKLEKDGRIHGTVNPTGTVSGRASHARPNTGNVPSRSKLGHECRSLFCAAPGKVLVGADASGLQLRILAHYLANWDSGTFAKQCETGDIHEYMRAATGLYTRPNQKTWTYAKLFGAGAAKLGQTVIVDHRQALVEGLVGEAAPHQSKAGALGRRSLTNLGNAIPAFTELEEQLEEAAAAGYLYTLDGRRLPISSAHVAIAMLLQGGEAVVMKRAMALAAQHLYACQSEYVLWVHDEFQVECAPEAADTIGSIMVEALATAGRYYNLRVRIDGEYKVGKTWAETH